MMFVYWKANKCSIYLSIYVGPEVDVIQFYLYLSFKIDNFCLKDDILSEN